MPRTLAAVLLATLAANAFAQTQEELLRRLFNVGNEYKTQGKHSEAIGVFSRVLKEDPGFSDAYYARGMSQLAIIIRTQSNRGMGRAAFDFSKAITRGRRDRLTYAARGFLRAMLGSTAGRGDLALAAGKGGGLPPVGYAGLAWYATEEGDYRNAAWLYKQAYASSPPNDPLRDWIGGRMIYVREKAYQQFRAEKTVVRRKSVGAAAYVIHNGKIDPDLNQEQMSILVEGKSKERAMAAKALGAPGNNKAVSLLIDALNDDVLLVQGHALLSLGKIGNPRAVAPIQTRLDHERPSVRFAATRALGDIASERARPSLENRLKVEKDTRVRKETKDSLKKIDESLFNMKFDLDTLLGQY